MSDNAVERHALHKSDESLAKDTVMRQLSTPAAWRRYRAGVGADGSPAPSTADERRADLKAAMKTFVSPGRDPDAMVTVSTTSGWVDPAERWFRGRDPTFNTTTSLELDRDTYRTVTVSFKSQLLPAQLMHFFGFGIAAVNTQKTLSMVTNTWAASPPMMRIRTARQLLPLSTGDPGSGTDANVLAYFGLKSDSGAANAADFVGMMPWWNFIGGANGLAGQFVLRQVGLDANAANGLAQSAGRSFGFKPADPAGSLLLKAQVTQSEYFNPLALNNGHHRHTVLVDKTAEQAAEDAGGPKSRNSNSGKRKYRAVSLQNPVETFFNEGE